MQQPPQMLPSFPPLTTDQIQKQPQQMLPSFPPLTTDQIQKLREEGSSRGEFSTFWRWKQEALVGKTRSSQNLDKYLEENKKLILAILENQNLGKLAECAQYQAQLQKNLMYLAAIADAQPQAPTMPAQVPPQMAPHPAMQAGGFYMQHPQAAAMSQQSGLFAQRPPLQFNSPHQLQEHLQQQHQHQQHQQQLHQHHQQAMQGQMGMRSGGANNGMHPPHAEATHGGGSSGVPPPSDARGGSKQDASEARAPGTRGPGSSGAGHGGGDGDLSHTKGTDEAK